MSSLFGEVWFWSLLAFLIGALLTWVLLVRPAQQRVNQLERQPQQRAPRPPRPAQGASGAMGAAGLAEPEYRRPEETEWPDAGGSAGPASPPTRWLEQDSLPAQRAEPYPPRQVEDDYRIGEDTGYRDDYPVAGEADYDQQYRDIEDLEELEQPTAAEDDELGLFEEEYDEEQPAGADIADRLGEPDTARPGFDALDADVDSDAATTRQAPPDAAEQTQFVQPEPMAWPEAPTQAQPPTPEPEPELELEEFTRRVPPRSDRTTPPAPVPTADEQAEPSLFEEEQPTSAIGPDGQLPDIEPDFDPDTGLPKRTRGASTQIRGGFEPPRPIQPSVRPIARRTPQADTMTSAGSLFEPTAADAAAQAPPARTPAAEQRSVPPGPFGPGSAMPLPGGGRPGADFTVKGSVTALRYCPEDSPRFGEMVAEVWFASADDAERVGFRPLG